MVIGHTHHTKCLRKILRRYNRKHTNKISNSSRKSQIIKYNSIPVQSILKRYKTYNVKSTFTTIPQNHGFRISYKIYTLNELF
jgi:hypothetical protein